MYDCYTNNNTQKGNFFVVLVCIMQAGWTLLHLAAQEGHDDVAEVLIQNGALDLINIENKVNKHSI